MTTARKIKLYPKSPLWRDLALLLGATVVLTAGTWLVRSPRMPLHADFSLYELELDAPVMQPADAIAAYEQNTHLFVDTRNIAIDPRRIPGSFSLRPDTFEDDLREIYDFLVPEDPLVLYGDGNLILVSNVVKKMQERGFENVSILSGGLIAWDQAGGELAAIEEGTP
jgi:rhodanese-related sulfurtransferase